MNEYKAFVKSLAENNINKVFLNSDKDHAVIVLAEMFGQAKSTVEIYADSLCEEVGKEPEYIKALSDYIERENSITNIILNKFDKSVVSQSDLFRRLAFYKSNGKNINIKETKIRPYIKDGDEPKTVHFTICDKKSYRFEFNTEERSAECNFNDPIQANLISTVFNKILINEQTTDVDLSLFN